MRHLLSHGGAMKKRQQEDTFVIRRLIAPIVVSVIGVVVIIIASLFLTAFRPSGIVHVTTPSSTKGHFVISRAGVLELNAQTATIHVRGKGKTVLAIGRSTDVSGWVAGIDYSEIVGMQSSTAFDIEHHRGKKLATRISDEEIHKDTTGAKAPAGTTGDSQAHPSSSGSLLSPQELEKIIHPEKADNWQVVRTGSDSVTLKWPQKYGFWSLIAYSSDSTPRVSITWKTPVSVSWVMPLLIIGIILFLLGVIWALAFLLWNRKKTQGAIRPKADKTTHAIGGKEQENDSDGIGTSDEIRTEDSFDNAHDTSVSDNHEQAQEAHVPGEDQTHIPSAHDFISGKVPSRKELRRARKQGQASIKVGDREFPTGLIPLVAPASPAQLHGRRDDENNDEGSQVLSLTGQENPATPDASDDIWANDNTATHSPENDEIKNEINSEINDEEALIDTPFSSLGEHVSSVNDESTDNDSADRDHSGQDTNHYAPDDELSATASLTADNMESLFTNDWSAFEDNNDIDIDDYWNGSIFTPSKWPHTDVTDIVAGMQETSVETTEEDTHPTHVDPNDDTDSHDAR